MTGTIRTTISALVMAMAFAGTALAADVQAHRGEDWGGRGEYHKGGYGRGNHGRGLGKFALFLGICAGQKLAAKGINLPTGPGERKKLDEATKKEIFASVKACKEEFKAAWKAKREADGKDDVKDDSKENPQDKDEINDKDAKE